MLCCGKKPIVTILVASKLNLRDQILKPDLSHVPAQQPKAGDFCSLKEFRDHVNNLGWQLISRKITHKDCGGHLCRPTPGLFCEQASDNRASHGD